MKPVTIANDISHKGNVGQEWIAQRRRGTEQEFCLGKPELNIKKHITLYQKTL
jgi:hypothetical protein